MEDFSESLSRPGTVNLSGCLRQIADHDLESSKHSPEPESPGALSKTPEQLCHIVLQYAVFQHSSTEFGNFVSDYNTQNISVYTFDSRAKFGELSLICPTSTSLCLHPKCQKSINHNSSMTIDDNVQSVVLHLRQPPSCQHVLWTPFPNVASCSKLPQGRHSCKLHSLTAHHNT